MANTTFSGPVRAGTIVDTTGTTLGTNVKNIGPVLLTQSSNVALTHATTTATAGSDATILVSQTKPAF